ncbi:peptide chain release factor N(5)-glutamine methyltransferase, partial [Acinetobacter baumannii]
QLQLSIDFMQSDWCQQLPKDLKADVIVSNPPYLAATDIHLVDSEISHEPRRALVADDEGLAAYQLIAEQAKHFLQPQASVYVEHGAAQS